MKKTNCISFICAAVILFSGCAEQNNHIPDDPQSSGSSGSHSDISSSSQSSSNSGSHSNSSSATQSSSNSATQSSSSSATQSSSSSATQSSSSSATQSSSSSATQSSSSSATQSSSSSSAIPAEEPNAFYEGTVSENSTLNISNGDVLGINEKVVCENGGQINIKKGGVLVLKGEIDLSGDLYVEGRLIIEENAKISGSGVIHVAEKFDDIECAGTVTAKIDAPEPVEINGVTYVGGILLVNKKYSLPKTYGDGLCPEVSEAIKEMRRDSGFSMKIISGFRSYSLQESVYAKWCKVHGVEKANTLSAQPGHSEHQTGLSADITSIYTSYANTAEGKWLTENCYKYGLIIRYPKGKTDITGYIYEPWHVRYVGKSTAKLIHDSGLCLEEFLGVSG